MHEYRLTNLDNKLLHVLPKQWWEHYAIHDGMMYWKRSIKKTRKQKPNEIPKSQLLYSPVHWTSDSPKKYCTALQDKEVMDKYLEFRQARWSKHKDNVTELWEKKMLNVMNKYPKAVLLELLTNSSAEWYKAILEDKYMIEKLMIKYRVDTWVKEQKEEDLKKEKEAKKALDAKQKRKQRIINSCKPESHWIEEARKSILEQFPAMDDLRMQYLIPAKINTLLDQQWF